MEVRFLTVLTIVRKAAGLGVIWPFERSVDNESGDSARHDSRNVTFDTIIQSNHLSNCESSNDHWLFTDQNQDVRSGCGCLFFDRIGNQRLLLKNFVQICNRVSILIQEDAQSMGRLMCFFLFHYCESLMMNFHHSRCCNSDNCVDTQEANIHLFNKICLLKNRFSLSTYVLALIKSSGYHKFVRPSLLMSS